MAPNAIAANLAQGQRRWCFCAKGDSVLFFGLIRVFIRNARKAIFNAKWPGVSSIYAASRALNHPLTVLKESFAVVQRSPFYAFGRLIPLETTRGTCGDHESRARSPSFLMALRKNQPHARRQIPRIHWSWKTNALYEMCLTLETSGPYFPCCGDKKRARYTGYVLSA